MRMTISLQSKIPAITVIWRSHTLCASFLAAAVLSILLLLGGRPVAAQTPVSSPKSAAGQKTAHHRARPSAAHHVTAQTETASTPIAPPAPAMPDWPANDKPSPASVVWDSQGLRIEAQNSSLEQIMNDVSTATGTKVEGLDTDQRVFGVYGPGHARDVLSELLQGSGYNVMMIGDEGQGTPRQILLSVRQKGEAHPGTPNQNQANTADEDTDNEDQQQQQSPGMPNRPGFPGPGAAPRTPQQIMQEMQQRQLEMQQRLQQNPQPNNPQN
jgi:hypothetical protein